MLEVMARISLQTSIGLAVSIHSIGSDMRRDTNTKVVLLRHHCYFSPCSEAPNVVFIQLIRNHPFLRSPLHRQPNKSKDDDILRRPASREMKLTTILTIHPAEVGQINLYRVLATYHMGHDRARLAFRKVIDIFFPRKYADNPANA
jgi:hypothetical protein